MEVTTPCAYRLSSELNFGERVVVLKFVKADIGNNSGM